MSRDHHITYNSKVACFSCRKSWRKGLYAAFARSVPRWRREDELVCPQCRGHLVDIGADFKAPAQSNIRQWRKVEQLVAAGVLFQVRRFTQSEGDMAGPGPRPYSLREVGGFLNKQEALRRRVLQQKRKQEKAAKGSQRREDRKARLARRKAVISSGSYDSP